MKKWQAGLLVAGGVLLAGCSHNKTTVNDGAPMEAAPMNAEAPGMVSSIMDAMGLGKTMVCTYKDPGNATATESTVTVQGQKFKSVTLAGGETSYAVSDGEAIYVWTDKTKQGFKMTNSCLEEMKESVPQGAASTVPEDPNKTFEKAQDVSCRETGSADFSIPTDVTFTDQCEMMKKSLEMMKSMPEIQNMQMPAGYGQ